MIHHRDCYIIIGFSVQKDEKSTDEKKSNSIFSFSRAGAYSALKNIKNEGYVYVSVTVENFMRNKKTSNSLNKYCLQWTIKTRVFFIFSIIFVYSGGNETAVRNCAMNEIYRSGTQ